MARTGEPIKKVTLKSGAVRYRLVVTEPRRNEDTGRYKQHTSTHRTYAEAKAALDKQRTSLREGSFVGRSAMTLGAWIETWLDGLTRPRENTRRGYASELKPVVAFMGDVPLQRVTEDRINELRDHLLATGGRRRKGQPEPGRSVVTVNKALGLLDACLAAAVVRRLVPRNPAENAGRAVDHGLRAKARSVWTQAQVAQFLDHVKDDRYAAGWRLSCRGLRRSEVLGLTWGCVDFDAGTVHVVQGRTPRKDASIGGDVATLTQLPKTGRSDRTIPVGDEAMRDLRSLRTTVAQERLILGKPLTDDDYVIVDSFGFPISPDWFSELFKRHAKAAGLPPVRLHDLRHSAATTMHLQGVPLAVAAAYLGHDVSMMLRVYTHGNLGFEDASKSLDGPRAREA